MIGNDATDFLQTLLLTNIQVSKSCESFANNLSANVNQSKLKYLELSN